MNLKALSKRFVSETEKFLCEYMELKESKDKQSMPTTEDDVNRLLSKSYMIAVFSNEE